MYVFLWSPEKSCRSSCGVLRIGVTFSNVSTDKSATLRKSANLGAAMREHRQLAGLTLSETARRMGIAKGYLSEIERGIKPLRPDMVIRIAEAIHQERP